MADINVERRGPSIWPWIIGLIILGLLIWAIAEIINRGAPPPQVATEVVPRPPAAAPPTAIAAPDLSTLLPLGPEDENAPATVRGQVVGQPIPAGFWVHTKENVVIFVRSTRPVKGNEPVAAIGTVRAAPAGEGGAWAAQARLQVPTAWAVNEQFYLDANAQPAAPGTAPGATAPQGTPGTQPGTQPGSTQPGGTPPGTAPGTPPGTPPGT